MAAAVYTEMCRGGGCGPWCFVQLVSAFVLCSHICYHDCFSFFLFLKGLIYLLCI